MDTNHANTQPPSKNDPSTLPRIRPKNSRHGFSLGRKYNYNHTRAAHRGKSKRSLRIHTMAKESNAPSSLTVCLSRTRAGPQHAQVIRELEQEVLQQELPVLKTFQPLERKPLAAVPKPVQLQLQQQQPDKPVEPEIQSPRRPAVPPPQPPLAKVPVGATAIAI